MKTDFKKTSYEDVKWI